MPSEKPTQSAREPSRWRQGFLYWLSPILLVSLGIHGLALLIPLPNRDEVIEQEVIELPEPIDVTTLPPIQAPDPDIEPLAVEPSAVEPLPTEPIVEVPPPENQLEQPLAIEPEPTAQPQTQPPEPASTPSQTPSQTPTQTPTPQNPITEVTRSLKGTSQLDATQDLTAFIQLHSTNPDSPLTSDFVRTTLTLEFPSDNYCLKTVSGEPATESSASVAVLMEKFDDGGLDWNDGKTVQLTGYKNVDDWVDKTVFSSDEPDPNAVDPVNIPDTPSFDIVQWLSENAPPPLFSESETEKVFLVSIQVSFSNNCQ